MSIRSFITVAASVLALMACQKTAEPVPELVPMSFCPADGQEVYGFTTKADPLVSNTTHTQMKVWGTRIDASSSTALIPGYKVEYSNTEGWQYNHITGQSLKYWDTFAQSFRFHAAAPYSAVSAMTADKIQLSMTAPVKSASGTVLYSNPKTVLPANFGKTVGLAFKQANARIDFFFRLATPQTGDEATDRFYIKDIKINPTDKKTFPTAATCTVSYDWNAGTTSLNYTATANSSQEQTISIGDAVYKPSQTGPSGEYKSPTSIYMVPSIDASLRWKISIKYNGVQKVVTMAADKCIWEAGKKYTYKVDVYTDFILVADVSVEDWVDETIDLEIEGD